MLNIRLHKEIPFHNYMGLFGPEYLIIYIIERFTGKQVNTNNRSILSQVHDGDIRFTQQSYGIRGTHYKTYMNQRQWAL